MQEEGRQKEKMAVYLADNPPTDIEMWRIKHLADYNVMDGSWYNTRSIYVAEIHVGFYVLHRNYLNFLHIFAKYRKRGYGREVVSQLCAKERGIYLHATPSARPFWAKCGFKLRQADSGEEDRSCVEMSL
jgi:hypothetical protein